MFPLIVCVSCRIDVRDFIGLSLSLFGDASPPVLFAYIDDFLRCDRVGVVTMLLLRSVFGSCSSCVSGIGSSCVSGMTDSFGGCVSGTKAKSEPSIWLP